jgi:excisionase family DNA binding protein
MKSVDEIASELGVSPRRVRALAQEGRLDAHKVGGRWLLGEPALNDRPRAGRPVRAANAWAILALLAGGSPGWIEGSVRSRLKQRARDPDWRLAALEHSEPRSKLALLQVLPGDLKKLMKEYRLVRSGASANYREIDILPPPNVIDAYVDELRLDAICRRFRPDMNPAAPNVVLRVPSIDWVLGFRGRAPAPVAACDLLESNDPRARRAGRDFLAELPAW